MDANNWREYDYAALWCARRGLTGALQDPLPDFLSVAVCNEIDAHTEEFQERVRSSAYMLAMERHHALNQEEV